MTTLLEPNYKYNIGDRVRWAYSDFRFTGVILGRHPGDHGRPVYYIEWQDGHKSNYTEQDFSLDCNGVELMVRLL